MDDGWNISLSNIPGIYLSPTHTSRSVWHWRLYFSCTLNCFAVPRRGFFFKKIFLLWSGVILPFYGVYIIASLSLFLSLTTAWTAPFPAMWRSRTTLCSSRGPWPTTSPARTSATPPTASGLALASWTSTSRVRSMQPVLSPFLCPLQ